MNEASFRRAEERLWMQVGVVPTEHRVPLRRDVVVRVQEVGSGPPILFIHGTTNSAASWAFLAGRLAPSFRCLLLDRPGCGLSGPLPAVPGVEGLPEHGDMLVVDVLDALGIGSAHLVSTSMGGYFAFRAAVAHPERVGRIVQLGWSLGAPTGRLPLLMRLASLPGAGRLMAAMPVNERVVRSMFRQIGLKEALEAGRIPQAVIDTYVALLRDTDTMANEVAIGGGASLLELVGRLELTDEILAGVRAPTLFLWGDRDPFGGPDDARAFVRRIPGAELQLVPGAGHAVWLDDLELAVDTVERHLDDNRRAVPEASPSGS